MFRLFFSLLTAVLFLNGLNAQTGNATTDRSTQQSLSPEETKRQRETNEVEGFARKLASLKSAFAEKNLSRTVAYEAFVLRAISTEANQMTAKVAALAPAEGKLATEAYTKAKSRLEKMNSTMAAFEGHTFDPAQPEAATRDFALLDEFLKMMQEELEALKKGQE